MISTTYWNQVTGWAERLIWDDRVLIPVSSQLAPRQLEKDLLKALTELAGSVNTELRVKSRRGNNPHARVYYLK
jgi:hypothetical protein